MRIKAVLLFLFAASLLAAVFSACSSWMPANEETAPVTEDAFLLPSVPATEAPTEAPTEEPTTKDPLAGTGITELDAFVPLPFNKEGVMELYKDALTDVKIRCPGFTKRQEMVAQDVTAEKGSLQFAERIFQVAAAQTLKASGSEEKSLVVAPHDDLKVRAEFPAFGETVGCTLTDFSVVKTAAAYTDGKTQKLVITVEDTLNAEPGTGDFSKIMPAVSRQSVAEGVGGSFVVLGSDNFRCDFNYTGNEIVLESDLATGRILSLTQKSVINVNVDLIMDLLLFKTSLLKAHGTLISRWAYTDFVWD